MPKNTVLIVEDESGTAKTLERMLQNGGYDVLGIVESGELAISEASRLRPDLILTDICLKGEMDGITAAEIIKQSTDVSIMYMTASTDEAYMKRAKETMPGGFIIKPLPSSKKEKDQLFANIEIALYNHGIEKKLRQEHALLEESEAKYRNLFNASADGIIIAETKSMRFMYANAAVCKALGYTEEEFKRLGVNEIHPKESLEYVISEFEAQARGEKTLAKNIPCLRKDGTIMYADVNTTTFIENDKTYSLGFFRDITEQKQAEEKIKIFSDAVNSAFDYFFLTDLKGNITYGNASAITAYGYTLEELLKLNITNLDADSEKSKEVMQALAVEGNWSGEVMNIRKSREIFPSILSAFIIKDGQGRPKGTMSIIKDITERKQAQEKLLESEERYNALFNRSLDIVYINDFEGRFIDANDAALNRLGYTREEIRSLHFASFLSEDQLSRAFEIVKEIRETGIQKNLVEFKLRRKDGTYIHLETQGSAIMSNGISIAIQSIGRDITERKALEEQLQQSEANFKGMFENAIEGMFQSTPDGKFLRVNPAYARIFGFNSPEELLATYTDIAKTVFSDSSKRDEFQRLIETDGVIRNFMFQGRKKDGHLIWLSENGRAVRDAYGTILYYEGFTEDITERREMQEKLISLSLTDDLTGLYNKRGFTELSNRMLGLAQRLKKQSEKEGQNLQIYPTLLYIDMDKLKEINDTLGHTKGGDAALKDLAQILRGTFTRENDVLGRLGGDEMGVFSIIESAGQLTEEAIIALFQNNLTEFNSTSNRPYQLSASCGVVFYDPGVHASLDDIITKADNRMYNAKKKKGARNRDNGYSKS